jgi:hypothetical protein
MSTPNESGLVSLALTDEQAYVVSVALMSRLDAVMNDDIKPLGASAFLEASVRQHDSATLYDAMNEMGRYVDALNAVGWPHDHYRPGFEYHDPALRARVAEEERDGC